MPAAAPHGLGALFLDKSNIYIVSQAAWWAGGLSGFTEQFVSLYFVLKALSLFGLGCVEIRDTIAFLDGLLVWWNSPTLSLQ